MKKKIIGCIVLSAILALVWVGAANAAAGFPNKRITYNICFNPGGESDITARFQEQALKKALGVDITINYKIGVWNSANGEEKFADYNAGTNNSVFNFSIGSTGGSTGGAAGATSVIACPFFSAFVIVLKTQETASSAFLLLPTSLATSATRSALFTLLHPLSSWIHKNATPILNEI